MQAANSAIAITRHEGARKNFSENLSKRLELLSTPYDQNSDQEKGARKGFTAVRDEHFDSTKLFERGSMTVVVAIANKDGQKGSIEELPFMSLMALSRLATVLRREGLKFEIWFIPDSTQQLPSDKEVKA